MNRSTKRLVGNFLVGFFTAFGAVSLVDGADFFQKLLIGLLAGATQGFLAVGRELVHENATTPNKGKKGPLEALPLLLVF